MSFLMFFVPGSLLATQLFACAIATPFRGPGVSGGRITGVADPDQAVVLSVTHARVDRSQRAEFDRHSRRIAGGLAEQPGLLGYSVRIEFFGDQLWTMTVWRSDADRENFVSSQRHRDGMAAGRPAVKSMTFARVTLPASRLPLSWSEAEALLAAEGETYPGDAN